LPSAHPVAQRASRRRGHGAIALVLGALALLAVAPSTFAADPTVGMAGNATTLGTDQVTPEAYYMRLLNCSRTGGYVNADGSCAGYGSGRYSSYVRPIEFNWGLTNNVSRPYAKLLATRGKCDHFLDGDPGDRMRRAGYHPSWWGENIGCRDGSTNVYSSILASHRAFQAEKPSNGGHWRNIKNSQYQFVGIGIYRYGSRVRLVVDFYRPA
jgi:hypothetical protein